MREGKKKKKDAEHFLFLLKFDVVFPQFFVAKIVYTLWAVSL